MKNKGCLNCGANRPPRVTGTYYCSDRCYIEANSTPEPNSGCWLWTGAVQGDGYGTGTRHYKQEVAHRIAFRAFRHEIPDGLNVLHRCDNRLCCSPDHLWLGTQAENVTDCIDKGRKRVVKGSGCHWAKITERQVSQIKTLLGVGVSQSDMAWVYDVDQSVISRIHTGASWKHVR